MSERPHSGYTFWWALWFVTRIALEIHGAPSRWWWLGHDLSLGVIEGVALLRSGPGDTLTFHVAVWTGGLWARRIQAGVLGLWIAWGIFIATPGGWDVDVATGHTIGPALFAGLFASWLPFHFYYETRRG